MTITPTRSQCSRPVNSPGSGAFSCTTPRYRRAPGAWDFPGTSFTALLRLCSEMLQSQTEHTFAFADLVGYTALTEAHGDEAAADLALAFADEVSLLAGEHGVEVVKTLGDAVMVRCADHGQAVRFGLRLLEQFSGRRGFPAIRIGMDTGPAVERSGDWFGRTVNLAARVAASPHAGVLLLPE